MKRKEVNLPSPELKIIISGGGTGGHIFPAIAIANALKKLKPGIELLFVGALGKMEMEKVPQAGYPIEGLWISGLQRKLTIRNLLFPVKIASSLFSAWRILNSFKPNVAVGVGGYASGPLLFMASMKGIPTLIQEQNSYAGITNKLLASRAGKICVAYDSMERFFPSDKICITGNPVRQDISNNPDLRSEALNYFGLDGNKKTVLIVGGSLGARTINESIQNGLGKFAEHEIQVVWQTGRSFASSAKTAVTTMPVPGVSKFEFIERMDYAYAVADVVIARAGASTISELTIVAKPAILVPSPNVAEDHQTRNALSLVNKQAAILVKDQDAGADLVSKAIELIHDTATCTTLSKAISQLAINDSDRLIAHEILKLAENN
jgi:UDP-N-acetylglucosamine--N-acetylmuramyl-(pentapeptide) pyrophosphoryl-undecaprenol N-acetylglucosamine transferase